MVPLSWKVEITYSLIHFSEFSFIQSFTCKAIQEFIQLISQGNSGWVATEKFWDNNPQYSHL